MIRVLVAEDSLTSRALLLGILRSDPEIEIVGEASNGVEALEKTRTLRPNVVTMDVEMPRLSGLEATKAIMRERPTPVVIISGDVDPKVVATSMQALQVGALAVLPKPVGPESPGFDASARLIIQTVKAMAGVKVIRHWADRQAAPQQPRPEASAVRVLAVAASTGGPAALHKMLSELSPRIAVPILVVQHMAPGFVSGFARWLDTMTRLPVRIASPREPLSPGTVYLAPEDRHLGIDRQCRAVVSQAPPDGTFRPSATFLFGSAAASFGSGVLAVVLTGMGDDGVAGLRAVRAAGGRVIAQDEETSVVFGMPGAAVDAGLADAVLPLPRIAARIEELV